MLVRFLDGGARQKGLQLHFQVTSDPCEFVAKAVVIPASQKKGHVVLAPPFDTDFSLCAMVAVTFIGGFFASPKDFTKATPPRGVTYQEHYKSAKSNWHMAVSAAVAVEFPTLPLLLRSIALAPGSCCVFYRSEKTLCKFFKKAVETTPQIMKRTCVLSKPADRAAVKKNVKDLYITPRVFLLNFQAGEGGVCPGWRAS